MMSELLSFEGMSQIRNRPQFWFPGAVKSAQALYTIFNGTNLYTYILHNLSSTLAFCKKRQTGCEGPSTRVGRESLCTNYLPSSHSLSSSAAFRKS